MSTYTFATSGEFSRAMHKLNKSNADATPGIINDSSKNGLKQTAFVDDDGVYLGFINSDHNGIRHYLRDDLWKLT